MAEWGRGVTLLLTVLIFFKHVRTLFAHNSTVLLKTIKKAYRTPLNYKIRFHSLIWILSNSFVWKKSPHLGFFARSLQYIGINWGLLIFVNCSSKKFPLGDFLPNSTPKKFPIADFWSNSTQKNLQHWFLTKFGV